MATQLWIAGIQNKSDKLVSLCLYICSKVDLAFLHQTDSGFNISKNRHHYHLYVTKWRLGEWDGTVVLHETGPLFKSMAEKCLLRDRSRRRNSMCGLLLSKCYTDNYCKPFYIFFFFFEISVGNENPQNQTTAIVETKWNITFNKFN